MIQQIMWLDQLLNIEQSRGCRTQPSFDHYCTVVTNKHNTDMYEQKTIRARPIQSSN